MDVGPSAPDSDARRFADKVHAVVPLAKGRVDFPSRVGSEPPVGSRD